MNNSKFSFLISLIALFITVQSLSAQQKGYACIYSKSLCGHTVATGGKLNCDKLTAAHRTFKFGSKVRVTNLENHKSVVVTINDRGPYSKKDIVDMTPTAAKKIGLDMNKGRVRVKVEKVKG
jgi:rare lipoprotein A